MKGIAKPLCMKLFLHLMIHDEVERSYSQSLLSGEHTGSQLHTDPDLTGAWSLLMSGAKWWVIIPTELPLEEMTCAPECSPDHHNQSLASPWFSHILPQLLQKR